MSGVEWSGVEARCMYVCMFFFRAFDDVYCGYCYTYGWVGFW